jgi:ornithine cyclodeaminase
MIVLDNNTLANLLSFQQITDAVEAAMIAYEKGQSIVPLRMHVDHGQDTLFCMPAWSDQVFATKLVAVFPGNKEKNLPVTNGTMVLNDGQTGIPLAFINATKLTALRTGAVGGIGIKYLTPPTETSVGLIGCGMQGIHQTAFACSMRPIKTLHYLHRSDESASRLKSFLHQYFPAVSIVPSFSPEELLNKTNVIITATTSAAPVLPDDETLLKGKHFIGVGSYKPSMQEFPNEVFKLAGKLFIDSEFARVETGDCINPVKEKILQDGNIHTIGKLLTKEQRVDVQETTAFKSAGMALFDLFVAQAMYAQAVMLNVGTRLDFD